MVSYLEQYRKTKSANVATTRRYDQEKVCVNWNPAVRVIGLPFRCDLKELSPQLPEDFSEVDIEAFYDRVYALASQI